MKGYSEKPSYLIELHTEEGIQKFKQYAQRNGIHYIAFENDRALRAVLDRKWEKSVFQFANNYY